MEAEQKTWKCARCGYSSSNQFVGDICPECGLAYWKCKKCGFLLTAEVPPEICPECGSRCEFLNVTCYIPECGGPGQVDPRL